MYLTKYYHGLSSPRFFFRKLTYDDIVSWMDFYENNPNLKYLGIDLNRTRYEMAKAWIDTQIERYEKNNFGQLGIILKETDELVGTVGFIISKHCKQGTIEIAIAIKPAYWKNGIGKEASITLINAVFENNFAETIVGRRHIDNYASQKCIQSLGFDEIGIQKEDLRTVVVFRLTKATWIKKHGFYYTTHHSMI